MGEAQELQPPADINGPKTDQAAQNPQENADQTNKITSSVSLIPTQYKWWLQMIIYVFFVIAGQSVGTLLGRLYFDNGGKSQWMATLVQVIGFPILCPFQWLTTTKNNQNNHQEYSNTNKKILVLFYIVIGIFLAADCMLYSIGLQYLPVTTYTLICASQLGFNSLFSFFLNKQKFTPYIVNSLVLLTISSVLLVFQTDPGDSNKSSKRKYIIGFLSTLGASAGYALMLSITQLAFQKIIKRETLRSIIDMTIYQNLVATLVVIMGLFASGDWREMEGEMEGYKLGKVSYVMNLFWTAVSWQVFSVGCTGLIFKISSLFSNVISMLGLPVAPVMAVVFLHDRLTGLKAMAMVLAMWGSVSYIYQQYLDDLKMKEEKRRADDEDHEKEVGEVGLVAGR